MRQILTDHSGQVWYVESDRPIIVKHCPNCGKPLYVESAELGPKTTHIRFRNSEGKILGVFDTEAYIASPLHLFPKCHFCGWEDHPTKVI